MNEISYLNNNKDNLDDLSIPLPDQKNFEIAYSQALNLAIDKLSLVKNIEDQCLKSGSHFNQTSGSINLVYLNRDYNISFPDVKIVLLNSSEHVELRDQIIILHYLTNSKGTPPSNKLITFREFSEGAIYYPSFFKRSIQPLINHFGQSPESMIQSGQDLGGTRTNLGDVSIIVPALPRLPITYVLWCGDDELPPNANILFDRNVLDYLPVEDIVVLSQTITWKLVNSLLSKNVLLK